MIEPSHNKVQMIDKVLGMQEQTHHRMLISHKEIR